MIHTLVSCGIPNCNEKSIGQNLRSIEQNKNLQECGICRCAIIEKHKSQKFGAEKLFSERVVDRLPLMTYGLKLRLEA